MLRLSAFCSAAAVLAAMLFSPGAGAETSTSCVSGYVTALGADGTIYVEGVPIRLPQGISFVEHGAKGTEELKSRPALWVGARVAIFGVPQHGGGYRITRFEIEQPGAAAAGSAAVTDRMPDADVPVGVQVPTGARLVRADGYWLVLTADSQVTFTAPLTKDSPLTTNLLVDYRGVQQADGSVLVKQAAFSPNRIPHAEKRLKQRMEYDPSAVPAGTHQSDLSEAFVGVNPKKLPPWPDEALQERVRRIGERVVPAYQKALPAGDPTRIDFRFEVVDSKNLTRTLALPSGIVLVSYQVVTLLQNDDQLAAVLAADVAVALEKQAYREMPAINTTAAVMTAAALASPFGLLAAPGGLLVGHHLHVQEQQQSERVSLQLMADAGYDIREAPRARWLLALKNGKTTETQAPSNDAAYLYDQLGTTWKAVLLKEDANRDGTRPGEDNTGPKN